MTAPDLSACNLVDLTRKLVPGREDRKLELRREVLEVDDTFWHEIDTVSHIGTHLECPSHFYESGGKDVADYTVGQCCGRAVLLDLSSTEAGAEMSAADLARAAAGRFEGGDIAVLTSGRSAEDERPHLTVESARYLADQRIKMLAIDDTISLGATVPIIREVHDIMMGVDIPFLENLANLDQLECDVFYLAAWPWPVEGLDSSPVRAVAFVPHE